MRVLSTAARSSQHTETLTAAMRGLGLFEPMSDEDLRTLSYFVSAVEFDEGEKAVRQGDPGDSFYIICSGSAEVRVPGLLGDEFLGALGPGDFFGELALLLDQPRNADVVCMEETQCIAMDRSDLEQLMSRNTAVEEAIRDIARKRFEGS